MRRKSKLFDSKHLLFQVQVISSSQSEPTEIHYITEQITEKSFSNRKCGKNTQDEKRVAEGENGMGSRVYVPPPPFLTGCTVFFSYTTTEIITNNDKNSSNASTTTARRQE